jgi:hypothetical protein
VVNVSGFCRHKSGRRIQEDQMGIMVAHLTIPVPPVISRVLLIGVALTLLDSTLSFVALPAHYAALPRRCTAQRCRRDTSLGLLELRAAVSSVVSKPAAKPRGYWHDFANVEAELRKVVADSGNTGQMPSTSTLRSSSCRFHQSSSSICKTAAPRCSVRPHTLVA